MGTRADAGWDPQSLFGPLAQGLLSHARLREDDRLLDVACGAWTVGREAMRRGARLVTGVDVDHSRLRAGGSDTACRARAEALPFADDTFSLVTCQHGLMFFADRGASLREAARVLRAGGRYAATGWYPLEQSPGFHALHRAIAADLGPEAAESAARPFSLGDPERVADEIADAGFTDVAIERIELRVAGRAEDFATWYLLGTSVARFAAGREQAVASIRRRVAEALAGAESRDGGVAAAAYCVRGTLEG